MNVTSRPSGSIGRAAAKMSMSAVEELTQRSMPMGPVNSVLLQDLRRERRARVLTSIDGVDQRAFRIAVLVRHHLMHPPIFPGGVEDPAVIGDLAILVVRALPGQDRRKASRGQGGDLVLVDRLKRRAEQTDLSRAPRLAGGPGDQRCIILGLAG